MKNKLYGNKVTQSFVDEKVDFSKKIEAAEAEKMKEEQKPVDIISEIRNYAKQHKTTAIFFGHVNSFEAIDYNDFMKFLDQVEKYKG